MAPHGLSNSVRAQSETKSTVSAVFLEAQVAAGHFASTTDALSEAVRLLEARDKALTELRGLIAAGEASGYSENFDLDEFIRDLKKKHAA